jgi:hypothetical protein
MIETIMALVEAHDSTPPPAPPDKTADIEARITDLERRVVQLEGKA